MATLFSSVTRMASLLSVLALAASLDACTPKPSGPEPAAEEFFAALAKGTPAERRSSPTVPRTRVPRSTRRGPVCRPSRWTRRCSSSKFAEDTGSVGYRYTWHLPKNRTWTYDGQLNMVRNEGRWEVRWSATGLHPKLGEHQTFALRADPPRRASVNERGGTDVLVPGNLYQFALDAKSAGAYLMTDGDRGRRCAAAVRRHHGPPATRRGGQFVAGAAEPDHAAPVRPRPGGGGARRACPASSSHRRPNCCPPTTISRPPSSARSRRR